MFGEELVPRSRSLLESDGEMILVEDGGNLGEFEGEKMGLKTRVF